MKKLRGIPSFLWRHKIWSGIGLVILVVIIISLIPKPPVPIPTEKVDYHDLTETVSVSGTVQANQEADLSFPTSGNLTYVGAQPGDSIHQGQAIASIDSYTLQKELQQALNTYRSTRDSFDQTQDNLQDSTLQQEQKAAYAAAGATASTTDKDLYTIVQRVLDENQANLDNSVINVDLANKALQLSTLLSPINGILVAPNPITNGMSVTATTKFTVIDPSSLVFAMDVDEADVGKVATGQAAMINLDAYPNENLTLPVTFIDFVSHVTTNGGNAFTTDVQLPGDKVGKYRVGMNGNGTIVVDQRKHVLTVPLASLVDNNAVYVQQGKKYKEVPLTLGIQNDTDAQVVKGLTVGERIVLDPSKVTPNLIAK